MKWEGRQTGVPALQKLVGARRMEHDKALLFFSGAGYSTPAIDYADDMDIALFKYALDGRMNPVSLAAHRLLLRLEREAARIDPPFTPHSTSQRLAPPTATTAMQKQPGRSWFGRNWTILVAVFFLLQAMNNGEGVIQGDAPSNIDWYDPMISLLVGLVFLAIWVRSREKGQQWKQLRKTATPPAVTTSISDR